MAEGVDFTKCPQHGVCHKMTTEQIQLIAQQANKIREDEFYHDVGKTIVHKILWLIGFAVVGTALWLVKVGVIRL